MIFHIMKQGALLCGLQADTDRHGWVSARSTPERFRRVSCATCLKVQICDCQERAEGAALESSVEFERGSERVCRETLACLRNREAS